MHKGKFGISLSTVSLFQATNVSIPDKRQALGLKCHNDSCLTTHIETSP